MIEMIVCGLMMWYHVDCVQFYQYDEPWTPFHPQWKVGYWGYSFIAEKMGVMILFNPHHKDMCGNSVMGHEYQRFHQEKWFTYWCN